MKNKNNKKTKTATLSPTVRETAALYAEGFIDACKTAKVTDPIHALTESDCYPRLLKIPMVEFMIGWLTGVAECHDLTVEALFDQIAEKARAA